MSGFEGGHTGSGSSAPAESADAVSYDNSATGIPSTTVQEAIDRMFVVGVPALIRRRYVIRNGIDGIVSGTVDNTQAGVNLAAMQAIVDDADANGGGIEMDQETIEIAGGPLIVRNTASGTVWDSPTFARLTQRTDNVGILQIGDTVDVCQNLDFSGINLHYLNDQSANTNAIACKIYNQWKSRIGKIQVANTITSARPYGGVWVPQSQTIFSCLFHNIFVFRASQYLLWIANFGTGNIWENIYLSAVQTNGAAGDCVNPLLWQMTGGSQMHDSSVDQLNIEWAISNQLMRINNVRGVGFKSIHIEQDILSGANASVINNVISNIQINALQILDLRIQAATATDFPAIHKQFNNGRTNIDTFCWVNNVGSYVDRSYYMHMQSDTDGFTTQTGYLQARSARWIDVTTPPVVRDNIIMDRTLGSTDMDGAVWPTFDMEGCNELSFGGAMSRIKGASCRVASTKTLYGQYLQDAPTITIPGNPASGADITITLSNMMGPSGSRWGDLEIPDGEVRTFHRGGPATGAATINNHDGTLILTIANGAATSRRHVAKVNGNWVEIT